MCTLDNHLYPRYLEVETIRRHLGEDFFNIDLLSCPSPRTEISDQFKWSQKDLVEPSTPVAVCKNKKIMLSHCYSRGLVQYDPLTKSLDFFYRNFMARRKVTYFQSLISHI
ncbi:BnaC03g56800D [Brassica napus]|uniref:BnaC03g56800D protein n=3 Tax=Brassica TaxID=3705 RepID=A0A078H7V0_BRANA|nr:BnaC03g56800D [Brassica napus]